MTIHDIIASLRAAANDSERIPLVNRNLNTIARAVAGSGQSANAFFLGHGIKLPLPMPDTIDEAVTALPAPRPRTTAMVNTIGVD